MRLIRALVVFLAASPVLSAAADDAPAVNIDITAQALDTARSQIQPRTGASVYEFDPAALDNLPQGADAPLNQVLLHAPGVAQDSFGQVHIRGDHANVQYRINGVELPEGLSVFGQALESRFARSMSLITGALPAQYGFQTAGVVDIQTKTGLSNPGLTVSAYGGMDGWAQPSFEYGGHSGNTDWFVTGDYLHNDRGIENPASGANAEHDTTDQFHGLAYASVILDTETRVSLVAGGFNGAFEIPNAAGSQPSLGYTVDGISDIDSGSLNERQRESTDFAILSLQKHYADVDVQVSGFSRYSSLYYSPDPIAELLFNGIAQQADRQDWATGTQADASWRVNPYHTLRAGFLVQGERIGASTFSEVLPLDSSGAQIGDTPVGIADGSGKTGGLYGVYLQDEWRILQDVTLNYGARFDDVDEYTHENQLSPRINLVWKATPTTTIHGGYSRYFTPPPFELVSSNSIANFANTSAAPATTQNDTVKAERSNYYDAGISQQIIPGLTIGLDAYYKDAKNLIDEGQFGAPIILSAFNYAKGQVNGLELSGTFDRGPWSFYGNVAYSRAIGKDIVSSQFNFDPADLAYISDHWIHLDHDQTWTGSAGAAYTANAGTEHPTRLSGDLSVQSGLRADADGVPNGAELPAYAVLNLAVTQTLRPGTQLRLDVLNVADTSYEIRDGTGVGVGAPQFGLRRTVLAGISQHF